MIERISFNPDDLVSVEVFVQVLIDNDRTGFLPGEAQDLARALNRPLVDVMKEIKGYGMTVVVNPRVPQARGFASNDHNLFASMGHHGGSGWEGISGFAGRAG